MRKNAQNHKRQAWVITALALGVAATAVSFTLAAFTLAFHTSDEDNNGKVGILSYFHCGDGSENNPFVITRPRHFYNLSMLQNLGAFSSGSYYFQIGYPIVSGDTNNYVYSSDVATSSDSNYYAKVLDMSDYTLTGKAAKSIHSIGNHSFPFRSSLTGNSIVIKNLTVESEPDDVGVFGYVSYEGKVSGLIFEGSDIVSKGYHTELSQVYVPNPEFDDSAVYHIPSGSDVTLTAADQFDDSDTRAALKGVTATALTTSTFGTFTVTIPTNDPTSSGSSIGTTYSLSSSTPFLGIAKASGTTYTITVNADLLATTDYSTFWDNESTVLISRLYLQANNTVDKFPVSRVISSYQIYIENRTNNADKTHDIGLGFIKDAYDDAQTDTYTQYHHGNNIGCVIGHLDGSATDIYSYDAKLEVNGASTTSTVTDYESYYGVIGETGEHVSGNLNPNKSIKGDVGYLYLDEVYNRIRSSATAKGRNGSSYYYYEPNVYDQGTDATTTSTYCKTEGSLYQNLIKTTAYTFTPTGTSVSAYDGFSPKSDQSLVSFYQKHIIKGRSDGGKDTSGNDIPVTYYDNSLGIYSLVTEWDSNYTGNAGNDGDDLLGDGNSIFAISNGKNVRSTSGSTVTPQRVLYVTNEVKDTTQHTDVNFYPYDTIAGGEYRGDPTPAWPRNYGTAGEVLTEEDWSVSSKRSRAYLFELKLDTDSSKVERYFHSTTYGYLTKDLENTLLTAQGTPMTRNNSLFGITLRQKITNGTKSTESDVSSFNHYWRVTGRRRIEFCNSDFSGKVSWNSVLGKLVNGNDGLGTSVYDENNLGKKYYAFGQIAFSLARACNVTVVFPYMNFQQGGSGHSPYLTVNRVDLSIKNPYGGTRYPYAACPIPNTSEVGSLYYYPQTANSTHTPVAWNTGSDGNPLFAHTFQLAAGDYFISTNVPGYKLPIAYLAIEGQTGGRLGSQSSYSISQDELKDVDFLTSSPSASDVVAYTDDKRNTWLAANRTWCITNLTFTASSSTIEYKSLDVTIDGESTTCFAIAFSETGGLKEIDATNYGGSSSIAGYVKKYVVFCDTSWNPIIDPSYAVVTSWYRS